MAKSLAEKGSLSSLLIIFNRTAKRSYELHSQVFNTTVVESIDAAASLFCWRCSLLPKRASLYLR
jgi:hypothetical protein